MCELRWTGATIAVDLTMEEARRIGDLNVDVQEIEIIRWRRKVRDAVREHDRYHTKINEMLKSDHA